MDYTEQRHKIEQALDSCGIAADLLEDVNDHGRAAEVRAWNNDEK